ncbi:MAG TPA: MTAP family purine nucleoside phosphorylase [Candidatus Bilamarchaeaceae archaeon]|nr:MTAP family purine nucleoside phosphorylase [Candidatus Bilamarchaeaceae archaeon]
MLAVIGGSGFYSLGKLVDKIDVITPYGHTTVHKVKIIKHEIFFIPRHGENHDTPPHMVNYRANIYALKKLGVKKVILSYAAGGIKYKPKDIVLIDDFIGLFTPITFYDSFANGMKHYDFTHPFDNKLQELTLRSAKKAKIPLKKGGIMVTTVGPRLETKAEIRALKKMGANLVNMTSAYEISLCREVELQSVAIASVVNYACGVTKKEITTEEIMENLKQCSEKTNKIIFNLIQLIS